MVGLAGKTTVEGAIERGGKAVPKMGHVPNTNTNTNTLTSVSLSNVETNSKLFIDQHDGHTAVGIHFDDQVINHAVDYVQDNNFDV
jgi:hypothetical protein